MNYERFIKWATALLVLVWILSCAALKAQTGTQAVYTAGGNLTYTGVVVNRVNGKTTEKVECGRVLTAGPVSIMAVPSADADAKNCASFGLAVATKDQSATHALVSVFYWHTTPINGKPMKLLRVKTVPVTLASEGFAAMSLSEPIGVTLDKVEKINVVLVEEHSTNEFWNYESDETPKSREGK